MAGRSPHNGSYPFDVMEDDNGDIVVIEYEDEEEEEEEEEEDSSTEDDDEDSSTDEDEENDSNIEEQVATVPPPQPPRVSPVCPTILSDDSEVSPRTRGGGETSSSQDASGREWNRSETDGLFCPICMEAWTNGGDHQVCCLPCGHLYGASCIKRWLQQRKNSGKCPQCNRKSTLKDVRVLYAQQIVAIDEEIQKKARSLEAKCASLEKKNNDWQKREEEWRRTEADLHLQVRQLRETSVVPFHGSQLSILWEKQLCSSGSFNMFLRKSYLERLLEDTQNRPPGLLNAYGGCTKQAMFGRNTDLKFSGQGSSSNFVLQNELQVDGAKLFDVDASSQICVIARKLSGVGGMHVLTKVLQMSLIAPHERENIALPVNTKVVKDLRVASHGRLALLVSLGKKLSVMSMESNNTVLSYDLPAAAWSCSWDLNSSHYLYAGLQNGTLLVFDMRQTLRPVESVVGLTCNPIHSMYSLVPDSTLPSGVRSLLTASSSGLCQWNFGAIEERAFLIPESENQGVCIALAYCPSSNHIVASFRPKVEMSNDMVVSQPSPAPVSSSMGQGVWGTHILYKALGNSCYQKLGSSCAYVNEVRLQKSAILYNHNLQFASTKEVTGEVVLQELPSFEVVQHLKSQPYPIRDVKYTHDLSSGRLSCLSDDRLRLFSRKNL